jgi:DNA-binding CsgD family transcriptional regulator
MPANAAVARPRRHRAVAPKFSDESGTQAGWSRVVAVWIRSPRLVGRELELAALVAALHEARTSQGGAVFLVGEAGIGKSRLAAELTDGAAADGIPVLRGRASSIGPMVPFRPVSEALLTLTRGRDVAATDELGPYLPALGVLVPDWHRDDRAGVSLVIIAEAVLRLLAVVSRHSGCVLLLDDLQDADAETLFIVDYLADNLAASRTLLLGTVRDEPSDALDLVRSAARRQSCRLVETTGLDEARVHRMAAACLGSPTADVPARVAEQLWRTSTGNPLIVEELVHEWVDDGLLTKGEHGWRIVGELPTVVPAALVRSVSVRAAPLGPDGVEVLAAGAILGHRFPLSVVQHATGAGDRAMLTHLRAAVSARLIAPDGETPGWFAFRHPLTAEALLAQVPPAHCGTLAARVSDAVEVLHPGLPGEWCARVGSLRLAAGDRVRAGLLFAEAGRRALADAAADSAVTLLAKADDLLVTHPEVRVRGAVRERLVYALGETGQFDKAVALATDFAGMAAADQATALHVKLAWVACLAGRHQDGLGQVAAARTLTGAGASGELHALIDAVHANLLIEVPGEDHLRTAERLARHALSFTTRHPAPEIACQSLQALGVLARVRDLDEARRWLEEARQVAEEHQLPLWRTHILMRLAGHHVLADADTSMLEPARREATRTGAVTATCAIDVIATLNTVLCADFDTAERLAAHDLATAIRLQLAHLIPCVHTTRAIIAAHQANRRDMDSAIADLQRCADDDSQDMALCIGLARAFCALLEEDPARARRELTAAASVPAKPSGFHLTGEHGVRLLLDVLAGERDLPAHQDAASTAASQLRWNRQFVLWADAVLLGRQGEPAAATKAADEALAAAEPYVLARHLALRLVADAAMTDGWGDPVGWLRAAEEHFHAASVRTVAGACRAMLRRFGEPVKQRRAGHDEVPGQLRATGVTVREYDVLRLLAQRLGNRDIARRLHISHRTVEKHVASLIGKTGQPHRAALTEYAATIRHSR